MVMNPIFIVLMWVGAYFMALALKQYVPRFSSWNFFLLMLLGIVVESFAFAILGAVLVETRR